MAKTEKQDGGSDKELQCTDKMTRQVLYFAYGSNMWSERLCSRVPSAKTIGRAILEDWKLMFNKRSKDGSAKDNLIESPGDTTWGVLYEIGTQDLDALDRAEGGYKRISVSTRTSDEKTVEAVTYVSTKLTDDHTAYAWYKDTIIAGAREHKLPQEHISYLKQFPTRPGKKF